MTRIITSKDYYQLLVCRRQMTIDTDNDQHKL